MLDNDVILQPGDELRVDRGAYHHHALYVGDNIVVQFGGRIKDKRPEPVKPGETLGR